MPWLVVRVEATPAPLILQLAEAVSLYRPKTRPYRASAGAATRRSAIPKRRGPGCASPGRDSRHCSTDGDQKAAVDNLSLSICAQWPAYEHRDGVPDGWAVLNPQLQEDGTPILDSQGDPTFDHVYSDKTNADLPPAIAALSAAHRPRGLRQLHPATAHAGRCLR